MEWMLELIMMAQLCTRLDEHALHGLPVIVVVGMRQAVHLPLPTDGVVVLFPSDAEEDLGTLVLEAHGLISLPVCPTALHGPHVQVVALAVLPESTHFLGVEMDRGTSAKLKADTGLRNTQQRPLCLLAI